MNVPPEQHPAPSRSLTVPVLLLALSLLLMVVLQLSDLLRERDVLRQRINEQERAVQEAARITAQVESIARGTALLAQQGNAGAKAVVEQLRQAGVTLNPNAPPSQ